jgi:hypothetical protein
MFYHVNDSWMLLKQSATIMQRIGKSNDRTLTSSDLSYVSCETLFMDVSNVHSSVVKNNSRHFIPRKEEHVSYSISTSNLT